MAEIRGAGGKAGFVTADLAGDASAVRDFAARVTAAAGGQAVAEIGGDTRLLVLDVTDAGSIEAAVRQVPALDILVDNAGISPDDAKPVTEEDPDTFRRAGCRPQQRPHASPRQSSPGRRR